MNYRQEIEDGCYAYGNKDMWPTPVLQTLGRAATMEKEEAIAHREQDLNRTVLHVEFELWYREQWEPNRVLMAAPVEISA